MLAKATEAGIDWVTYLPLAMCALRMVPNRDTGYSPYELTFGRKMHGPLDIVYEGWVEEKFENLDVYTWVSGLAEKLKVLSETAVARSVMASKNRKIVYDKGKSDRRLMVDDKVLIRVPDLHGALEASWEGPYVVTKVNSCVSYFVRRVGGCAEKLVHKNNT